MTLTLTIRNMDRLENGVPAEFVLHRRGGVIGRAPTCDWCLPDTTNYISSRHCEIAFRDGQYVLTDVSTNGTYLNGSEARMPGEYQLKQDDVLHIGQYEIVAKLSGTAAASQSAAEAAANATPEWRGWTNEPAPQPDNQGGWGAPASTPAPPPAPTGPLGWGASPGGAPSRPAPFGGASPPPPPPPPAAGWDPSHRAPVASAWEEAPPPPDSPSGWSSAAPDRPPAPSPDDIWGKLAADNVVDWARGGFGVQQPPAADPLGLERTPAASLPKSAPGANAGWGPAASGDTNPPAAPAAGPPGWGPDPGAGAAPPPAPPEPYRAPTPPPAAGLPAGAELDAFLAALGLDRQQVPNASAATLTGAAHVLKRLVAGLVVMVDARAKAKAQLGAEATNFQFDGNNPIKFARTTEQALAQLLQPPQRGFMDAERAVEDAYFDLQSHQMAMLKAMQGALRATLARFSPTAIQQRAENKGVLARIVPAARDAALWQNYQREFSGVAQGSDEAFMDVFAKEFRTAYEEQARLQRPR